MFSVNPALLWVILMIFASLGCGTVVRIMALRGAAADTAQARFGSLKTWWILAGILSIAVILGQAGILIILTCSAVLALREFVTLVGRDAIGSTTLVAVFVGTLLYYCALWSCNHDSIRTTAPIVFVLVLCSLRASLGVTSDYIRTTGAILLGMLLFLYALSHAYFLYEVSEAEPRVGRIGWFLYLVLLTETNDIAQAVIGRRFGKTKITRRVSPNKSLEGLMGGVVVVTILSSVSAPWLTTLTKAETTISALLISVTCGVVISLVGFLGDINMSAIKRDVGVKDGSTLLPGQGGMIDRIDSLTLTAPAFYYFVRLVMKVTHE